jgi:ABC-type transport system involved in cytochrome c biogenesis permease subunit
MDAGKKARLVNAVFLLNGLLFLLGGIGLVQENKIVVGIPHFMAAFLNLSMLANMLTRRMRAWADYVVYAMNIVVASFIAVDYFLMEKKYIQYVWILAAIMSFVALLGHYRREKTKTL